MQTEIIQKVNCGKMNESEKIKYEIMAIIQKIDNLNNEYNLLSNEFEKELNRKKLDELENELEICEEVLINNPGDNKYFFKKLSYYQHSLKFLEKNSPLSSQIINRKVEIGNLIAKKMLFFQFNGFESSTNEMKSVQDLIKFNNDKIGLMSLDINEIKTEVKTGVAEIKDLKDVAIDKFNKIDSNLLNFIEENKKILKDEQSDLSSNNEIENVDSNYQYDQNGYNSENVDPNYQYDQNGYNSENVDPNYQYDQNGYDNENVDPNYQYDQNGYDSENVDQNYQYDQNDYGNENVDPNYQYDQNGYDNQGYGSNYQSNQV